LGAARAQDVVTPLVVRERTDGSCSCATVRLWCLGRWSVLVAVSLGRWRECADPGWIDARTCGPGWSDARRACSGGRWDLVPLVRGCYRERNQRCGPIT